MEGLPDRPCRADQHPGRRNPRGGRGLDPGNRPTVGRRPARRRPHPGRRPRRMARRPGRRPHRHQPSQTRARHSSRSPRPPTAHRPGSRRPRPTRPGRHTLGPLATSIDPRLTTDPYWPQLADRLTAAGRAGLDVAALAIAVAADQALPDEQPAAALWWRLARHLSPAALHASPTHTATTLRPAWTPLLTTLFT